MDKDGRWMQEDGSYESLENRWLFFIFMLDDVLQEAKKKYSAEQ
ncbi:MULTISPECIES: hypothetical protein [Chryseobacterium]|nr:MULTISPECIES: hypothetical protein [Chryseobacterium]MDR6920680.1 hypothetical protein [Chryseobacterium sp. 2987]